jgi:predicted RNA-binding protein with RPS1 domain
MTGRVISFLEKSSEAKEKPSTRKTKPEMSSSRNLNEEVGVEPISEKTDEADNGSMRTSQRGGRSESYRHEMWSEQESREDRNMSFEEKLRAFKKQSEERLLHIKRSREAKIGKKKVR